MAEIPGERRSVEERSVGPLYKQRSRNRPNPFARTLKPSAKGSLRAQIVGNIHQPVPPQCTITIHVWINLREREFRKKQMNLFRPDNSTLLAPLGDDPSIFEIQQNALLFTIMNDPVYAATMPRRSVHAGNPVSSLTVFECVNGLQRGVQLKFIGSHALRENPDVADSALDLSTCITSGTCTCINTGPEEIKAFSHVYFDEEPYTLVGPGGEILNGIYEFGQPGGTGVGVSSNKFRPALYGMNSTDVAHILMESTKEFDKKFDSRMRTADGEDVADIDDALYPTLANDAHEKITEMMQLRPKTMPIERILWAQLAANVLGRTTNAQTMQAVSKTLVDNVLKDIREERKQYNKSIDKPTRSMAPLFGIFDVAVPLDDDEAAVHKAKMLRSLGQLRDMLVMMLRGWFTDHYVGLALNSSPSGMQLNLSLSQGSG